MEEEIQNAKSVSSNSCLADSESCFFAESCVSKAYSCKMRRTSQNPQRYKPGREIVKLQLRAMFKAQEIDRLELEWGKKGAKVAF